MLTDPWEEWQHQKTGLNWENTWGNAEVSISASVMAPYTKFLEVPEAHRNISRPLGRCWHTCGQSASAKNLGWVQQIYGGVGRSISQLLLGPHAPKFWRFLRHIGIFLHQPQVADTPMDVSRSNQHTHSSFTQFSHGINHHSLNSFHIHIIEWFTMQSI